MVETTDSYVFTSPQVLEAEREVARLQAELPAAEQAVAAAEAALVKAETEYQDAQQIFETASRAYVDLQPYQHVRILVGTQVMNEELKRNKRYTDEKDVLAHQGAIESAKHDKGIAWKHAQEAIRDVNRRRAAAHRVQQQRDQLTHAIAHAERQLDQAKRDEIAGVTGRQDALARLRAWLR